MAEYTGNLSASTTTGDGKWTYGTIPWNLSVSGYGRGVCAQLNGVNPSSGPVTGHGSSSDRLAAALNCSNRYQGQAIAWGLTGYSGISTSGADKIIIWEGQGQPVATFGGGKDPEPPSGDGECLECFSTCSAGCENTCDAGYCTGSCDDECTGCSGDCQGQCEDGCYDQCTSCRDGCGLQCGHCGHICAHECGQSCKLFCDNVCGEKCDNSCNLSCTSACGGCSSLCYSCVGQCIGVCSVRCQETCSHCSMQCGWWCDTTCNRDCFANCDTHCISDCTGQCVTFLKSDTIADVSENIRQDKNTHPTSDDYPDPKNRSDQRDSFRKWKL